MEKVISLGCRFQSLLNTTRAVDFIGPLALRIYLAPIFILAGWGKLKDLESTAYYFGEYLDLPFPDLMAFLAGITEFFGGIALIIGIATRWISVPLMVTMLVAATTAHWSNGWHALPESTLTMPWEWRMDLIEGAQERKEMATAILSEHGNFNWLTETGNFTILKNGIEFAATYFIMLMVLFFSGAGKLSIDYLVSKKFSHCSHS